MDKGYKFFALVNENFSDSQQTLVEFWDKKSFESWANKIMQMKTIDFESPCSGSWGLTEIKKQAIYYYREPDSVMYEVCVSGFWELNNTGESYGYIQYEADAVSSPVGGIFAECFILHYKSTPKGEAILEAENAKTGLEEINTCTEQIGNNTQKIIDLCDRWKTE